MLTPVEPPPEPSETLADPRELLVGYLEFYRDAILRKLDGMPDEELRRSRLPSGWTPLELLKHLAGVERRWFRWGFAAERLDSPWVEGGPGDPWRVGAEESADDVKALFLDECARARRVARVRVTASVRVARIASPQPAVAPTSAARCGRRWSRPTRKDPVIAPTPKPVQTAPRMLGPPKTCATWIGNATSTG